jgi:hypothetical protein
MQRFLLVSATLAFATFAFADIPDAVQINYASNLNQGDAYVNVTNGGQYGAFLGLNNSNGDICVNVYIFDPAQEMLACCSCRVTPDGLNSFSVKNDLINKTLTPAVPTAIVIKLVATQTGTGTCSGSAAKTFDGNLAAGMRAWGTTLHQNNQGGYSLTENAFSNVSIGSDETRMLPQMCGFVLAEGSQQFGFCNNKCTNNGLAGGKK